MRAGLTAVAKRTSALSLGRGVGMGVQLALFSVFSVGDQLEVQVHTEDLTPSLPRCHLKTTNKSAKFSLWHVKGLSLKRIALKVEVLLGDFSEAGLLE